MMSKKSPDLMQSLQNPALFPHEVNHFKMIETHISWVLLTGPYAYKVKKPLNLGFLDFSSLEKRRHFCFEELRLNSRLAPDIYLDVVTVGGTEKHPILNGSGPAIEYAVKMRQFEPDKTFDQLLIQNQLTGQHLKKTAQIIADFHSKIEQAPADTEFGSAEAVMYPVRENFSQIMQLHGIEKPDYLKYLASWSEQQHTELLHFFTQRKQNGFIRACHGDLHLGNIALENSQIIPFDCIEFNPSLYWIDVISEVAFLVMDLQDKQRHDLAFQFLNAYLQHSGDYESLKILRFYLVYRAIVKAKVNAIRAAQSPSNDERQQAIESYQRYLELAYYYPQPFKPIIIIMNGVSGSGKSWLSEQIIDRYQAIRIRSDVERKRLHNMQAQQKSHSEVASGLYSQASSDLTYQHLCQLAFEVVGAAYNVVVDATFLQFKQRQQFSNRAEQLKVPFLIINTQSDKQTLLKRLQQRNKQEDNISEANETVLETQLQTMQALSDKELKSAVAIDTGKPKHLNTLWKFLDERCQSSRLG